ncbi:MAG TPA: amidohydrolase family protein [Alphaproteobacteria bacterium]|nr:amidohydrolase family protein [Alphaproteobacteria bacterium]
MPEPSAAAIAIDLMVIDATLVTMDAQRRIIKDGAIAVHDGIIVAIGKSADLKPKYQAHETIDGRRFVITPGLVNTHVHVTGEPLTRGLVPDDAGFEENVFQWLVPVHMAYTEADERLASQCAALEMLRTGTTCFLEAGTIRFLDSVVDGLTEIGIRGRVGQWAWDFNPQDQSHPKAATDAAIRLLDDEIARYPAGAGQRIAAWPILIGHMTCSGDLWRAAKNLADRHGVGVGAHMSPVQADPDWFLARHGCRPIEYLHQIDALGSNTVFTHAVHLNDSEVALLADAGASIAHCATSALKGAYGATAVGKMPEMQTRGVNVTIGTDGNNNSNYHDLMRATYLLAGLFKDCRRDPTLFPTERAFTCATLNGAKALRLSDQIGSLEPGKKADFVAHDTWRSEWRPLFDIPNQLVWSADGRGVHSVWVDGKRVIDNYRCTTVDEDRLFAEAQAAGEKIVERAGLSVKSRWPVI